MTLEKLLKEKREEIFALAKKHGASNIRVFGSLVRGENTPASDIDFLVDTLPGRSLLDMGGLLMDLQDLLQTEVDIVTEKGIRPRLRPHILKEAIPL